jgi:mannosyltransferase OCH1-like enzyme
VASLIPKILHQIWLGPHRMSDEFLYWNLKWQVLHPDWKVLLWDDKSRPLLRNEEQFQKTTNWSNRSNLLRYELILDHGGVYADVDFEPQKRIDPLLEGADFFAGCEKLPENWIAPGLFGAVPNHPIVKELVDLVPSEGGRVEDPMYCATIYFTKIVQRYPEAKILPPGTFYPYYCWEMERRHESFPDAYAVHHWARSWISNSL